MAGENPDDARTGASDEFLSKNEVAAVPGPDHGPGDEPGAGAGGDGGRALSGRRCPRVHAAAGRRRDRRGRLAGTKPRAFSRAITSSVSTAIAVDTWEEFGSRRWPKANRQVELDVIRAGKTMDVDVVPTADGKYEIGDHRRACPPLQPQVASLQPGEPADDGRPARRRRDPAAVRRTGDRPRTALIEIIRANEESRCRSKSSATVVDADDPCHAAEDSATSCMIGAQFNACSKSRTIEPGPSRGVQDERAAELDWAKLIVQTLGGLFTRDTSVKQLMGPVAIADSVGRGGAAGLDLSSSA